MTEDTLTPEGAKRLAKVRKHLLVAQAEFNLLNATDQRVCFDFHAEDKYLAYCLRWGCQAASDLVEAARQPAKVKSSSQV